MVKQKLGDAHVTNSTASDTLPQATRLQAQHSGAPTIPPSQGHAGPGGQDGGLQVTGDIRARDTRCPRTERHMLTPITSLQRKEPAMGTSQPFSIMNSSLVSLDISTFPHYFHISLLLFYHLMFTVNECMNFPSCTWLFFLMCAGD